jgi:hypothetical protein
VVEPYRHAAVGSPSGHRTRTPGVSVRPERRGRATVSLAVALAALLGGCTDPATDVSDEVGSAVLLVDDERLELATLACDLGDTGFRERVPDGGTERTLRAAGTDDEGTPVEVVVRRTAAPQPPERIETVEVTIGDPAVSVAALVLYRAYDAASDTWTEIDADRADARRPVGGPLVELEGTQLVAVGTAATPDDGRPVLVRLTARCPITSDEPPGLAVGSAPAG